MKTFHCDLSKLATDKPVAAAPINEVVKKQTLPKLFTFRVDAPKSMDIVLDPSTKLTGEIQKLSVIVEDCIHSWFSGKEPLSREEYDARFSTLCEGVSRYKKALGIKVIA